MGRGEVVERDVDELIDELGFGRYQQLIVLLCGIGNAADAVEIMAMSYMLPILKDQLPAWGLSLISASVFAGMLLGGLVFGILSDQIGRRVTLCSCMAINAVFGAVFALCPVNSIVLAIVRFCSGFGIGGSVPLVFSLTSEFVAPLHRGFWINVIAACWMVGSVGVALVAWATIDSLGWRPFAMLCIIPAAIDTLMCFAIKESPRFYIAKRQEHKAMEVIRSIAIMNGREHTIDPHVRLRMPPPSAATTTSDETTTLRNETSTLLGNGLGATLRNLWSLAFNSQYSRVFLMLLVVWFAMNFGWYGILIWMPTYLEEKGIKGMGDGDLYKSAFLVAAANLPGNILSAVLTDRVGRRKLLLCGLLSSALTGVTMALVSAHWLVVACACLFNGVSVLGWNNLSCISTESFPTIVRTSFIGLLAAAGRVAAFTSQFLHVSSAPGLPLYVGCATLLVGALMVLRLTETSGARLEDTVSTSASC